MINTFSDVVVQQFCIASAAKHIFNTTIIKFIINNKISQFIDANVCTHVLRYTTVLDVPEDAQRF